MSPDLLMGAGFAVQLHVLAAISAIVLGPVALLRRSRDRWHRVAGRLWVLAMALTAMSSFWIHGYRLLWGFSPIHLLSVLVLVSLVTGVRGIRSGQRADHAATMRALYVWGIGVPGLFTLLPGRLMSEVLFPAAPLAGFLGVAGALGLTAVALYRRGPERA
ncbi:MAG: DUF2306 domain-containing protein [Rubellimicrobium sp.]|nr:DUF2306 domain-containing protein [Rubellimicrobium sp.]